MVPQVRRLSFTLLFVRCAHTVCFFAFYHLRVVVCDPPVCRVCCFTVVFVDFVSRELVPRGRGARAKKIYTSRFIVASLGVVLTPMKDKKNKQNKNKRRWGGLVPASGILRVHVPWSAC